MVKVPYGWFSRDDKASVRLADGTKDCSLMVMETPTGGVLYLRGELDCSTAPGVVRRLLDDPTVAVLDMAAVTFVDMSALGALLLAARDRCAPLVLRSASPRTMRTIALAGLAGALTIEASRAGAARPPVGRRGRPRPHDGSPCRQFAATVAHCSRCVS